MIPMAWDFIVGADEHGQRNAWFATDAGRVCFDAHIAEFDLGDLGIELDVTETRYDEFVAAVVGAGLTIKVNDGLNNLGT